MVSENRAAGNGSVGRSDLLIAVNFATSTADPGERVGIADNGSERRIHGPELRVRAEVLVVDVIVAEHGGKSLGWSGWRFPMQRRPMIDDQPRAFRPLRRTCEGVFPRRRAIVLAFTAATLAACSARGPLYTMHDKTCTGIGNSHECARAVEKRELARNPPSIRREGRKLSIVVANGKNVTFTDARDSDDSQAVWYSYIGSLADVGEHVVEVQYYEGTSYLLVNSKTGSQTSSAGMPVASPSGDRVVATSVDLGARYNPTAVQIWKVTPGGLEVEYEQMFDGKDDVWGPGEPTWRGDRRIRFQKMYVDGETRGFAELVLKPTGWVLEGGDCHRPDRPELCNPRHEARASDGFHCSMRRRSDNSEA